MHPSSRPSHGRPPVRPPTQLPPARAHRRLRLGVLTLALLLLATGLAWLGGEHLWPTQTPDGPVPPAADAWLMRLHGITGWLTALGLGAVWQAHVRPAWRRGPRSPRRASGIATLAAFGLLVATAIGLQYAPEPAHATLSLAHWVPGIAGAAAALWHLGARRRRHG